MAKLCIILFSFISTIVYAQQGIIKLSVKDNPNAEFSIVSPTNGNLFWGNRNHYTLDSSGKANIKIEIKKSGEFQILVPGKAFYFFLSPNQNYDIAIDLKNKQTPVSITGANAEAQLFYNLLNGRSADATSSSYLKKDANLSHLADSTNKYLAVELRTLTKLRKDKKMDEEMFQSATYAAKYFYGSMRLMAHLGPLQNLKFSKTDSAYSEVKIKEFEKEWLAIFKDYPVDEYKATSTHRFEEYLNYYNGWHLGYFQASMDGSYETLKKEDNWKLGYVRFEQNFKPPLREFILAARLYYILAQDKYQSFVPGFFEDYKKEFPKSPYSIYLEPMVKKVVLYQQTAKTNFKPAQILLSNYATINTFDELVQNFKDKLIYVDIWASWCGPCKAEFEYNTDLKKFLKEKGAEVLYISMDEEKADKDWQAMIKYYDLAGTHVRTSPKLRQDLINKFWAGKGYAIPKYLIVKNGVIVEGDALRPSDKTLLYKQIEKYL